MLRWTIIFVIIALIAGVLRIKSLIENYTEVPFFIVDSSEEAIQLAKQHDFIA